MYSAMRFWRLPARQRVLLIQAAANLALVSIGLAFLPFKRAIRLGATRSRSGPVCEPEDVIWAVEAIAKRVPWRTVCIHKSITAQRMLRRRGLDAMLHYGIGHGDERDGLAAHVWVSLNDIPLIGGNEARSFAPVATFP